MQQESMKKVNYQNSLERISTEDSASIVDDNAVAVYYDYSEKFRWILGIGVILLTVCIGPPFLNWPSYREIFGASGAYNHLCDNPDNRVDIMCKEKVLALQNLGGFCSSIYFSFTFFVGILFDCVGSKLSTMAGMFVNALGWVIISFSGPNFDGFKAGMFLVAASTDAMYFGILSVANLFPGYSSSVLALLGSARSVSFAIPLIMEALFNSGSSLLAICLGQAAVITCLLILTALFIPYRSFPKPPVNVRKLDREPGPNKIPMREYVNVFPKLSTGTMKKSALNQLNQIIIYLRKPSYLAFLLIMVVALIRNGYFLETTEKHFEVGEKFYSVIQPFSFIPCPVLGLVVDKISAALTSCIVALSGVISLALVMIGGTFCEYLSSVFNWVYISFIVSQCYCYIAYIYPQEVLGKLAGLCISVAGLISFSTNSMSRYAEQGATQLLTMDLFMILCGLVATAIGFLLYFYLEKPLRKSRVFKTGAKHNVDCEANKCTGKANNESLNQFTNEVVVI